MKCDDNAFEVQVLTCYCITHYEKDPNITVVVACLYVCPQLHGSDYHGGLCCEPARDGQLCGGCNFFSSPAYS